jgi:hypothetical protein
MVRGKVAVILLLSALCFSDGLKIRSKEHIERQPQILRFAGLLNIEIATEKWKSIN